MRGKVSSNSFSKVSVTWYPQHFVLIMISNFRVFFSYFPFSSSWYHAKYVCKNKSEFPCLYEANDCIFIEVNYSSYVFYFKHVTYFSMMSNFELEIVSGKISFETVWRGQEKLLVGMQNYVIKILKYWYMEFFFLLLNC